MRPIKFRAWIPSVVARDWVGGMVEPSAVWQDGSITYDTRYYTGAVIQQFTGINDKNIKEVFEGDIVDIHDTTIGTEDIVRGEVYWCDSYLCWSIQWLPKQSGADSMRLVKKSLKRSNETPSSDLGDRRWPFIEVIGNIYENPELLK